MSSKNKSSDKSNKSAYISIRQFFQPYYRPKLKQSKTNKFFNSFIGMLIRRLNLMDEYEKSLENVELDEKELSLIDDTNNEINLSDTEVKDIQNELDKIDVKNNLNFSNNDDEVVVVKEKKKPQSTEYGSDEVFEKSSSVNVLHMIKVKKPLDKVYLLKYKPKKDELWYFHDKTRHQVFARFEPESGMRYKDRNSGKRRKLTALIYPKNVGEFDRTHVVPFGYHGSENDPRLVIGWDSNQNRVALNKFEQQIKAINQPIYWFTDIRRTSYGAVWRYAIFSVENGQLIDKLVVSFGNRKQPVRFFWKEDNLV